MNDPQLAFITILALTLVFYIIHKNILATVLLSAGTSVIIIQVYSFVTSLDISKPWVLQMLLNLVIFSLISLAIVLLIRLAESLLDKSNKKVK